MTPPSKPSRWAWLCLFALLSIALPVSGCQRSPEARKANHLSRGDRYFADEQYREAIIEYLNVLRIEPTNTQALRKAGLAHYELGELGQSYQFLLRTQQLDPANTEARLKLASIYLAGQKITEARDEATFVLDKDPDNLDALTLFAAAAKTPPEIDLAIQRLELKRSEFESSAKFHLVLGGLYNRKKDFEKAEQSIKEAIAREPKSVPAHTMLGDFYVGRGEMKLAEPEFKAAADASPVASAARVHLADYYVMLGKPQEGRKILQEITAKAPDFLPAWRRLASLALVDKNYDEANRVLDGLLKVNADDVDGHLLRGRVHLAKNELTDAIQEFQRVLKNEPQLAPARYQLALALLQAGNGEQAKRELGQVVSTAPNFVEARLLLAQLNLQSGAPDAVVADLEKLVNEQPKNVDARILLGSAHVAKKDFGLAGQTFAKILEVAPDDARGPYFYGLALANQGQLDEAAQQFEAALRLNPRYPEALSQLLTIAFSKRQPDQALARVEQQIQRVPNSSQLYELLGGVHLRRKESDLAEKAYSKAIDLEPRSLTAFVALGQIYAEGKRYDEALAKFEKAHEVTPKNVAPLMMIGIVHELRGDFAKATAAYEQAIALDASYAPAANNLAYLYTEHGGDKEKALALAQTAKGALPDDPRVSDTLGWILYKRGVYDGAVRLLSESAAKLPDLADVQFHLGMAQYKSKNSAAAKRALARALELNPSFDGHDEARRILTELH